MSPFATHLVTTEDGDRSLTIFLPGEHPITVQDDHPNFERLVALTESPGSGTDGDAKYVRELADLSVAVATRFEKLSERVSVADGRVYFDGDPVDDAITRQIVRALDADGLLSGSARALVAFIENVAANPNDHSREQLFVWLRARDFTITPDGQFIAYKGVRRDLTSVRSGPAIVDGEAVNGHVPNRIGSTVEMARATVAHDPSQGCSVGLHVGEFAYAQGWAQGALLKVKVNPRDVVSVPTDCGAAKVRVCRYTVVETIDAPETAPIEGGAQDGPLGDPDDECCPGCGSEDYDPDLGECFGTPGCDYY